MWSLGNLKTVVPILSNSHVRSWRWSLSLLLKDRRKKCGSLYPREMLKNMEFLDFRRVDMGVLCTEADLVAVLQDCSQTCTGK